MTTGPLCLPCGRVYALGRRPGCGRGVARPAGSSLLLASVFRSGFDRFGNYFDLEDFGPEFASDEDSIVRRIVGNAVEHGFMVCSLGIGQQAGQVDPSQHDPGCGRDAGDAVGVPDVCVDLAVDEFEFIELSHGSAVIFDHNFPDRAEGGWIEEAQSCAAVAQDQALAVLSQSPAFAVVLKGAQKAESGAVVD